MPWRYIDLNALLDDLTELEERNEDSANWSDIWDIIERQKEYRAESVRWIPVRIPRRPENEVPVLLTISGINRYVVVGYWDEHEQTWNPVELMEEPFDQDQVLAWKELDRYEGR